MVKIEIISEAQAVAETTKGPAGERVREAGQALVKMGLGQSLKVVGKEEVFLYKLAFQRAAAAMELKVRLRVVGDMLYVMHGQQGPDRSEEPEDPDEPEAADEGQVSEPPDQESEQRADESLAHTRVELDAALGESAADNAPDRCLWAEHPHEHDAEGRCLLPRKSE